MSSELNVDTPSGVAATCEALCYYLNLRLMSNTLGKSAKLPEGLEKIVELALTLPKPETNNWSALANAKLSAKSTKPAGGGENGDEPKKARGQWTDEKIRELVNLVDNEDYRKEVLGTNAFVWASMARHFGFSKANPLQRQYQLQTGKEPPHTKAKKPSDGAAAGEPAAKKAKVEAAPSDGWTKAQSDELIKLVEDEKYRKQITNKSHLKWSRIADHFDKGKKECKKKYTALTGKSIDD